MRFKKLFIVFLLIFASTVLSQKDLDFYIDSVRIIHNETSDDYIKVKMEYNLAWYYFNYNHYDSALFYSKRALKKSIEKRYDTVFTRSLIIVGAVFAAKEQHDSVVKYLSEGDFFYKKKRENLLYTEEEVRIKSILAYSHTKVGHYDKAFLIYQQSDKIYKSLNDTNGLIFNSISKIELFSKIQAYDQCLKLINEIEKMNKTEIQQGDLLLKKAATYDKIYGKDSSVKYYRSAINYLTIKEKYKIGLGTGYGNLANIYARENIWDSAFIYNNKACDIFHEIGLKSQKVNIVLNNIDFLIQTKEYNTAIQSLDTIKEVPENLKSLYYFIKGEIFEKQDSYTEAISHYERSLYYAKDYRDIKRQKDIHHALYLIYQNRNDFKNALVHKKIDNTLQDSIFNQEKSLAIQKVVIEKIIDENNFRIKQSALKHEQQMVKESQKFWMIFALSLGLLVLVVFFYQSFKIIKQKAKITLAQNQLLQNENRQAKSDLEKISFEWEKGKDFLKQTKEELKKIRLSDEKESKINSLFVVTNQFILNEEKKNDFQEKIKEIQDSFFVKLDQLGKLTKTEKKMAALLSLGLTSREIALILNVTQKTIETYRFRLRKKLNISPETDLTLFFKNL